MGSLSSLEATVHSSEWRAPYAGRHSPVPVHQVRRSRDGSLSAWNLLHEGEPVSPDIEGARNVNHMGALADAAVIGSLAGLACTPDFMVVDQVAAGKLQIVLPDWQYPGDWVYMVYPRRRYFSPRLRVFSDFVRSLLGPMPPWQRKLRS